MENVVEVFYEQTGKSTDTNFMGMREMQERAFAVRTEQYILLKAPPASGKSRALMYIGLDKLVNQGIDKVIVSVPQKAIGGSFKTTDLKTNGFFADWVIEDNCFLVDDVDDSKITAFSDFIKSDKKILVCTHATLRFALEKIDINKLDNTLLAIDEFHHVSADIGNKLGELIRDVINKTTAHIVAMTGSYFRGDSLPILLPEDEEKFRGKVTYTYYEQLNGYKYLKSLGIGFHFYRNKYTSVISELLDENKKTIIHIPHPNSRESFGKIEGVGEIIDLIGDIVHTDNQTGLHTVKSKRDGRLLKIADLVEDSDLTKRDKTLNYLRNISSKDDIDIIIAIGMAKEGFDWVYCEVALTIGYRNSFTEIIQIIGRCTRDCEGKTHAQFINLVAEPDATGQRVADAVNDVLKAITVSLLMEQVLAPNFKFKTKLSDEQKPKEGEVLIRGLKEPSSKRVKAIVEEDINDLKVKILDDEDIRRALIDDSIPASVINKELIPKVICEKYPNLTEDEVEEVRQYIVTDTLLKSTKVDENGDLRFIKNAEKFINIDDLHIDLIDSISPFQLAYKILSKQLTTNVFKAIQDTIDSTRIPMTEEEALLRYSAISEFYNKYKRPPSNKSLDKVEKRLGEAYLYLRNVINRRGNEKRE